MEISGLWYPKKIMLAKSPNLPGKRFFFLKELFTQKKRKFTHMIYLKVKVAFPNLCFFTTECVQAISVRNVGELFDTVTWW